MFLKETGFIFRVLLEVPDPTQFSHGSVLAPGRLVGRHLLATYAKIDLRISVFSRTRKGYFFSFANRKVTCIHNKACDAPLQTNRVYYLENGSNIVTAEITSIRSPRRLGAADKLCIQASIYCRACVLVTRPGTRRPQVEVQKCSIYLYFCFCIFFFCL